jgi:hypothetical protein
MSNSELLPDAKTITVEILERFPVIHRGCDTKSLNTKSIEPPSIWFGAKNLIVVYIFILISRFHNETQ